MTQIKIIGINTPSREENARLTAVDRLVAMCDEAMDDKKKIRVISPKPAKQNINKKKRVAAYCRVSTGSSEQLNSLETQQRVYSKMIPANPDWEFVGIYADEGISGTQARKRDEFNRMIADCYAGKIDYIVTKSVSRFARNVVECLEYVRNLRKKGVGVFFEEQNIDTLKSESELFLVIYAGFAQAESESISKNITWAIRKGYESGKVQYNYNNWIGYRKGEDNRPEIVPEEAEIIREIYRLFLDGYTIREICAYLEEKGYKAVSGEPKWYTATICDILRNERYCGDAILQKTITVDCITHKHKPNEGEAPMYYVDNCHKGIITHREYQRALAEMERRNSLGIDESIDSSGMVRYTRYVLSTILICENCNARYQRVVRNASTNPFFAWRCHSRHTYGPPACPSSPTLKEIPLHAAITRAITKFSSEHIETYQQRLSEYIANIKELHFATEKIGELQEESLQLKKELANSAYSLGKDQLAKARIIKAMDSIENLSVEMEDLQKEIENDPVIKRSIEKVIQTDKQIRQGNAPFDEGLTRFFIKKIVVHSDRQIDVIFADDVIITEHVSKK